MVFIFRLIEFLFVLSVIRSAVNFVRRFWSGLSASGFRIAKTPRTPQPQSSVLKMDPVCGTYVAVDSSFKKISRGQVYHFCSAACRDRFTA
jgi:YHS domain-containing protein